MNRKLLMDIPVLGGITHSYNSYFFNIIDDIVYSDKIKFLFNNSIKLGDIYMYGYKKAKKFKKKIQRLHGNKIDGSMDDRAHLDTYFQELLNLKSIIDDDEDCEFHLIENNELVTYTRLFFSYKRL